MPVGARQLWLYSKISKKKLMLKKNYSKIQKPQIYLQNLKNTFWYGKLVSKRSFLLFLQKCSKKVNKL